MGRLPAEPARPQPNRFTRAAAHAVDRLRKARIPFRPGEVVVGDDPFNGCRQGTVEVIRPPYLGLRVPGTPIGTLVFFDYRTVRHPE